jgi:phosphoribosyl-ATP pyrophosphohydrolase
VHETADVLYHLLVSLEVANIRFEDVLKELESRKKQSGIDEKKNRK